MNSRITHRLQLLAAAALFSTGGAAIKATELSAWQVASFRSGIAALAVFLHQYGPALHRNPLSRSRVADQARFPLPGAERTELPDL